MSQLKLINKFGVSEIRQLVRGKSLGRMLMNNFAATKEIAGDVLDLGSKTDSASYHRYLKRLEPCSIAHTDLETDEKNESVLALDLERVFPLQSGIFDTVLCFNVLEHLYNPGNAFKESFRVLKDDGCMIGAVPFFVRYHPDPQDYFRYTHESLLKLAKEAGFCKVEVTPLGLGPLSTAATLICVYLPVWLRVLVLPVPILFDFLLFRKKQIREPLGYGFFLQK